MKIGKAYMHLAHSTPSLHGKSSFQPPFYPECREMKQNRDSKLLAKNGCGNARPWAEEASQVLLCKRRPVEI